MSLIPFEEAKSYLRVDSDFEDGLISALLAAAEALCCDVARLSDECWEEICSDEITSMSVFRRRDLMRAAVFYTLAYLYEHREEADHHDLVITLRNILFPLREETI